MWRPSSRKMTEHMERQQKSGRSLQAGPGEPAGLYVHVPFCSGKCAYCDFFSITDLGRAADWAGLVRREAGLLGGSFEPFDTLHLGGGTPSILGVETLDLLIGTLRRELSFLPDTEITLEVNPEDVRPEGLSAYRAMGVNRISMGIQSLDDRVLRFLGRRHSAVRALGALQDILNAGFQSVSVDLIYGVPGQDSAGWMETLSCVLEHGPQHISCYELTVSPGTLLSERIASGEAFMPDEDDLRAMFLATSRRLEAGGFTHYEVSNFARPGHESRHNRKYWRRAPYLGLGPGAHSFKHPLRWWNPPSLDLYAEQLSLNTRPSDCREVLTPEQDVLERLWLGFRTLDGVDSNDLAGAVHADQIARDLERSGLVTRNGPRLVPTTQGFLVSDRLPLLFAA